MNKIEDKNNILAENYKKWCLNIYNNSPSAKELSALLRKLKQEKI